MGEEVSGKMELYGKPIIFEKPTVIQGFNSKGEVRKYIEIIDKNALNGTDMRDTALKHNHHDVIARVRNKSLQLIPVADGLEMRAMLPDTQKSKDIYTEVKEGLLPEMSFAFPLESMGTKSEWTRSADGTPVRRITFIPKLIDVSTAYNGAYEDTKIFARSFDALDSELEALDNEKRRLDSEAEMLELRKRKIKLKMKEMY